MFAGLVSSGVCGMYGVPGAPDWCDFCGSNFEVRFGLYRVPYAKMKEAMTTFWNRSLVKRSSCTAFVLVLFFFFGVSAHAQSSDVNVNLYGTFPSTASRGQSTIAGISQPPLTQTADSSLGFRIGARHMFRPLLGVEINYGYNRATQNYVGSPSESGPIYAHGKPFTIDYVATFRAFHGFHPFVLGGGGFVSYNISSYSAFPARAEKLPAGEYGLGADYKPRMLPSFMALRLQYRGLIEHAPDFRLTYLQTSNFINIAEPSVGLVFKF